MGATSFDREWARGRELGLEGAAQLGLAWARRGIEGVPGDEVAAELVVEPAELDRTPNES
jgi:hypothetical protein